MKAIEARLAALEVRHRYLTEPEPLNEAADQQWLYDLFLRGQLSFQGRMVTTTHPELQPLAEELSAEGPADALFCPLSPAQAASALAALDSGVIALQTLEWGRGRQVTELRRCGAVGDEYVVLGCAFTPR